MKEDSTDPLTYLHSDSEDDQIKKISVQDQGSKPHRARVLVQGVPAYGIVTSMEAVFFWNQIET